MRAKERLHAGCDAAERRLMAERLERRGGRGGRPRGHPPPPPPPPTDHDYRPTSAVTPDLEFALTGATR
jgi:hypothetical protein